MEEFYVSPFWRLWGPNNVGAYAWVSRKMRAEKLSARGKISESRGGDVWSN